MTLERASQESTGHSKLWSNKYETNTGCAKMPLSVSFGTSTVR